MNWTLRIRAREEAIKRRWPERNDPDKLGERWVLRSHIIRLRYERIAERERWAPLDGSSRYLPKDPARDTYRSASSRAAAFDQALREAMGSSVTERFNVEGAPASDPSAGTASPKGVAVDAVASDPAVTDPRPKSYDSDRVKHGTSVNPQEIWNKRVRSGGERYMAAENAERERNRRARLRRWQETRG